jgi:hypothetical protein
MSTKETVKQLQEYVNVPLAELVESSTNPRKTFDEERLEELAESIRSKGILMQEKAFTHCFDGFYAANDSDRSLVPASRLQTWIEHNVYLSLKSAPFSKDDETLVPEAGSCANCPKRTGFNTLLFSEVREDS